MYLMIQIALYFYSYFADCKSFSLSIEYQIINPKSGIQFVVPSTDNEHIKKSFHAFTCGHYNSSRLWFPCMDNYWNLCTWSLSFNVDATMIAISNGELVKKIIDDDGKNVTFHYKLDVPTAAPNIGFAIGYFEIFVDPKIPTVTHFCLPGLLPVLKHSVSLFHKAYDLYQSILSARFPFKSYKQVFVNESYNNCSTYSSLSILNTGLLHSARIIEQHHLSQHVMAIALAQQYFGCFVGIETWNDWWLTAGISGYLSAIFIKRRFGTSEYKHYIHKEMEALSEYEFAGPPLPPLHVDETLTQVHTDISVAYTNQQDRIPINYHPCFTFPTQLEMFERRSQLIMRMIEIRIGQESLLQAFNKLLTLANTGAKHHSHSSQWGNLLISTKHFLKTIHLVSGKDIKEFINQWVCRSGLPHFKGSFSFNRKRNTLELELTEKQDKSQFGFYVGPLTICVQEVDGSYTHTLQIEESTYHYDISCHSKSKKNKKKKIPLSNGDETEINFSSADSDSPVLWVRIDPDMHWLRKVTFDQPDYMWQYQMKYERDSLAQYLAVKALAKYVSADSVCCLTEIINDRHIYYRIRVAAIKALAKVTGEWALQRCSIATSLFNIYRKMFGSRSCQTIPRYNDFSYMIGYFIQKAIPKALGSIRNSHGNCPREILDFIIDLIKYNDNSQNEYSDNYYMSSLIDALTSAISPATTITGISESNYTLSEESKIILQEVTHALNYEKILASHRNCISVSCIKNIRMLQKKGHIPPRADVFRMYARYGFFQDIREAAIDQLADFIKVESSVADLRWIFSLIEKDPVPFMRHYALQAIIRSAPFSNLKRTTSALNNIELIERLWTLIGFDTKHDCRLRCDAMELYTELYGRSTPDCIPPILNSVSLRQFESLQ
ncbi:uncharacterized protein TRIADDRAFT_27954 [Trichoplax adhaerens]|uniref:Transcription initiation factor TFIID subunit 2 n=1 Tax=Trichoplax adhaerens TaxID=10228 RepID=B3S247_TRIAD|nr:hypothetical protein TRIADDRAFT_27954 [Trichoplax adhaerens]EDV23052.1 hypothetical protein TRIADDRAFT_27954 [Trichoplax adhaerens]|eukprot:XP_002113962.1 hypothetical protein TRIADDRAFT_27954 [Trichoplax adhaerens]